MQVIPDFDLCDLDRDAGAFRHPDVYKRQVLEDALGVHFSDGFLRVRVEPTMEYTLECAFPGGKLRIVSAAGSRCV